MTDKLGLLAILAVSLGMNKPSTKKKTQLVVKQNNQELLRINMGNKGRKLFKIKLANGYTAKIEASNGKVRVKRMPSLICPRHICSDMGWIKPGDDKQIICMPNKLLIYFE